MEKIKNLKKLLKREYIDGYIIPKNDEFFGEYVSKNNDRLNYITNFSGSYGFALILKGKNYLFVDGRYTLQANNQSGNNFKIILIPHKMPNDILKRKKLTIGYDPKLFTKKTLSIFFSKSKCKLKPLNHNLIDEIWHRKFKKNNNKFFALPDYSVGEQYKSKIKKIAFFINKRKADFFLVTASENNAWLLNIRGCDSKYTPIPHSYILIDKNKRLIFFCDLKKISISLKKKFKEVYFKDIKSLDKVLSQINKKKFIIDRNTCSLFFENIILKNNKILKCEDPIYSLKAIKNKKEIKNIKAAHIYDGAALTRYLFWLKKIF